MKRKVKTLVIEDEPSVADALRIILEDKGYDVRVARNGREGLQLASKQQFDVTITDLRLPDISGITVLKAICEQNPNCLMIMITAHGSSEVTAEAKRCGAIEVLPKPFIASDILKLISAALTV